MYSLKSFLGNKVMSKFFLICDCLLMGFFFDLVNGTKSDFNSKDLMKASLQMKKESKDMPFSREPVRLLCGG